MKSSWLEQVLEKGIELLNKDKVRKQMEVYVLDPLLNHVMERVFPYIVLTCILFTLLLILTMLIFGILVVQIKGNTNILIPSALNIIPQ